MGVTFLLFITIVGIMIASLITSRKRINNALVTRLEVIDNDGRVYINTNVDKLELSYQDDGKTLKIFAYGNGK